MKGKIIVKKYLLLFFAASLAQGCTYSTDVVKLGDQRASFPIRTQKDKIQVMREKPDTAFIAVALLACSGNDSPILSEIPIPVGKNASFNVGLTLPANQAGALGKLQEKASKLGGDAIVLMLLGERRWMEQDYTTFTTEEKREVVARAVVIRYVP